MIKFTCPSCKSENEILIKVPDLTRGQKTSCLYCQTELAVILGVYSMEYALKKLIKKKEK
jgi:hypothetical protein